MENCLFCKIIKNEIPAQKVYENSTCIIIKDIDPQAPMHYLAIPKRHYEAIHQIPAEEKHICCDLFDSISMFLTKEGLDQKGYRLVLNSGKNAGQSVFHIHVHILSGREMHWPPG
ncbi:HIT domain-containing protein [Chitinispirillales bacterium ANBcel5]|uniref:HIT domain-containing protein n=1 Tax=Cellulosispirillum alkaliphilum TaxID=3039283 RepID=UPI002A56399D|nr:HIT domain-containing protein [Chitinispirillales bacterium ANBcel5]